MQKDYNERKYFEHYSKHTYFVVLAWKEIQDILIEDHIINEDEFHQINQLVIWHDNSKISADEWVLYARKFHPIGNQDRDEVDSEFKKAVEHHKSNNLHHFESLKHYTGSDWRNYIIEMICDYIAMGWEFGVYIFEYYEKNKEKIDLRPEQKEYLELVLNVLRNPSMHFIEEPITNKRMTYLYFK